MINKILDLIFPRQCFSCGINYDYICPECKKNIEYHPEICPSCLEMSKNYKLCAVCSNISNFSLDGNIILYTYSNLVRQLVFSFKYKGAKEVGDFFADRLYYSLFSNQALNLDNSIITYIPMHWYKKYFVRGYNHSEFLAIKLSEKLNKDVLELFKKTKFTFSQTHFGRLGRLKNLKNSILFLNNTDLSKYDSIIIVDDIFTTGTTLNYSASLIKDKYPHLKVWGVVLARNFKKS